MSKQVTQDEKENPKDSEGRKKPQMWLFPPKVKIGIVRALENGASKYGAYNYRHNGKTVKPSVYISAAERHIGAWADGEELAEDSKVNHLDHAIACLVILRDAAMEGNLLDDRERSKEFIND